MNDTYQSRQRLLAICLVLTMLFTLFPVHLGVFAQDVESDKERTVTQATYLTVTSQTYLNIVEEALERAKEYYEKEAHVVDNTSNYYGFLAAMRSAGVDFSKLAWQRTPWDEGTVWQQGKEDIGSVIEYAGYILGSLTLGLDPEEFGEGALKRNLVAELSDWQQSNGSFGYSLYDHVWAMIALDAAGADYNQAQAVQYLLSKQDAKGSFEEKYMWDGVEYADDVTGWSLVALANHRGDPATEAAIAQAKGYLKNIQLSDGDFGDPDPTNEFYYLNPNVNLLAVSISGLIAVGEDLSSAAWTTDEGYTPIDALLSYQLADGSFTWKKDDPGVIGYATKDAVVALKEISTGESVWNQLQSLPKPTPVYTKQVTFQVEGIESSIFPKQALIVQSTKQEISALDVLEYALKREGMSYQLIGDWLYSIEDIEYGAFGGWDGWNYLVNGHYSIHYLPGEWLISDGDHLCFYYGGERSLYPDSGGAEQVEQLTLVPNISIEPAQPSANQALKIQITADYAIRDLWTDEIIGHDSAKVAGAKVLFNQQEFVTDSEGQVTIPGNLVKQGENQLVVSKDVANSYPQLVRWEKIIIASGTDGGHSGTPVQETVTFSVRGLNQYLYSTREVPYEPDDTPYSILERVLPGQVEASGSGSSLYVKKIAGLAEFDHGPGSGWMYAVNGNYPTQSGAGSYLLQPGDRVEWRYTTNLGEDLGAPGAGGGGVPSGQLPSQYAATQQELTKLALGPDNRKPIDEVGKTVVVLNIDKRMGKEEAERLQRRLATHSFTLQETIGPALGGSLEDGEQEVTLFIPAGGVENSTTIQVRKLTSTEPLVGQEEVLSGVYEFLPAGIQFAKPVFISIKIPLLIDNIEELALAWWDEEREEWIPIPAVVDAERGLVTGTVTHFTKFAVIDKTKLAGYQEDRRWKDVLHQSIAWLKKKAELSEWEAFGLARAGEDVPSTYLRSLETLIKDNNAQFRKVTDLERIVLTLVALGSDPQDFAGYNLVEQIYNHANMTMQGTNGLAFALIALDSKPFAIAEGAEWNREKLIQALLAEQNEDGGFSLSKATGIKSDVDITAMVLQSLAIYKERRDVQEAIERALSWLSKQQLANGGFANSEGLENSESVAQVMIALTSLDIDPADPRFVQENGTLLSNLLSFADEDGYFVHVRGQDRDDLATEQAVLALIAYQRWHDQQLALFDLRHVEEQTGMPEAKRLDYEDADEISFWAKEAVRRAGEHGLMRGVSEAAPRFEPKRPLTRAEFATLMLNLVQDQQEATLQLSFQDVPEQAWYYQPVARAVELGWMNGIDSTYFQPNRGITRQEIAVILARMLELEEEAEEQPQALPKDLALASSWATQAITQVYSHELLVGDQGYFRPHELLTREMAAVLIMRLY